MRPALLLVLACALLGGCDEGVSGESSPPTLMTAQGGRFVHAPFPAAIPDPDAGSPDAGAPDAGGDTDAGLPPPAVHTITASSLDIRQGFRGKAVGLLVSENARTVAVELEGDSGYWVVPVGAQSVESPPDLDVPLTLDFSSDVPVGPARLVVAAQDEMGRFGPASYVELRVLSSLPTGDLVVSLDWTADADLDLIVVAPDGTTLASDDAPRDATGARIRPGPGVPFIDIDSNANCIVDGARTENAVWTDAAPTGAYRVFVRMTAACGVASTGWRVRIARGDTIVATVTGASYASEETLPGGGLTGMGRLAATFSVGD